MPRFYFNLYDDFVSPDHEGRDFPNLEAARTNSLNEARHLISQAALNGRIVLHYRIDIADDRGRVIHETRFGEAVEIVECISAVVERVTESGHQRARQGE